MVGTQTEDAGVAGPVPVTEYVAPAPAVAPFSAPAVSYEAPAPVVGYVAPAPAVTYAAPAPVVGFDSPAPSVTFAASAPVIDYVAPAPSVTYAEAAPVFEYVAPAPVLEYIASAPAVSFVAPSQQFRPAYTADSVTTCVNLDAEFVGSASQVVGSLPHGEVFAAPVFHQVHQEQLAGGEIPENLVEFPVVQKQVIVQASPHVVDTAENFTIFPVVQEQVLVGLRPAPPAEVAGPQCAAATGGYVAAGVPSLSVVQVSDMMHDDTTVQYLLVQSSRQAELDRRKRRVEEEEMKAKEKKEKQKAAAKELVAVMGVGNWIELVDSDTGCTYFWNPQTNATWWTLPGSSSSSSTSKRKKKKKRRKLWPRRWTARTR